jgi:hypothetical protein
MPEKNELLLAHSCVRKEAEPALHGCKKVKTSVKEPFVLHAEKFTNML